jgi:hypothetical protein
VVGEGRPAKIAATPGSYTGQFLTRYYKSSDGGLEPLDPDDESADPVTMHPNGSKIAERTGEVEGPASVRSTPKAKAAKRAERRKKKTGRP